MHIHKKEINNGRSRGRGEGNFREREEKEMLREEERSGEKEPPPAGLVLAYCPLKLLRGSGGQDPAL